MSTRHSWLVLIALAVVLVATAVPMAFTEPILQPVHKSTPREVPDENPSIDFRGFLEIAREVQPIRERRRLSEADFIRMAAEEGTIVLDTRSAAAYADVHIEGAVHLNFSDITKKRIAEVIPSKETRVLIYCNNNFESDLNSLLDKRKRSALNIPTFITLYEYGYKNVYELGARVDERTTALKLVGLRTE